MKRKIALLLILLSIPTFAFAATLTSMSMLQVKQTIGGKTIATIPLTMLNHKLLSNSIKVYFDKSGKMQGQFTKKPADGPRSDNGTWSVKASGLLCVHWEHWNDGKQACIYVFDGKNSVFFIGTDGDLNSVVLKNEIMPGNQVDRK